MKTKYKVITLCGSTRFRDEFYEAQKRLTLEGNIVISVGLFGHSGDDEVWENMDEGTLTKTKEMLDDMHKRKIDMADEIYVINVGGYIGSSTRSEIEYALTAGKTVRYLEERSSRAVCVFGASSPDLDRNIVDKVTALSEYLGSCGCSLVFGGFANGLMDAAANGFARAGAEITGVVPESLSSVRNVHHACTNVIRTDGLADRKAKMLEISDAFVAVPGGTGTLDELFSVLALKGVGELDKPVVLYNPDGFYDPLLSWLDELTRKGFMYRKLSEVLFVSDGFESIKDCILASAAD